VDTGSWWRRPHPGLRDCVEWYVGYRHVSAPGVHHGLPSGSLTVVIAFGEPVDLAWSGALGSRARFWMVASGLHSRPALITHSGRQHGVQLALTPLGARRLFGMPAAALAREFVPLTVLPHDELAAGSWQERFAALDRALLDLLDRHVRDGVPPEVLRAWQLLDRSGGRIRVGELADEVGWSRRHLGQRFVGELGITPKEAARVFRFQHSRKLVTAGRRLADAAAVAGYADQAHLTREWRALAGYAPTEYLREELPFLQDDGGPRVARSSA
jgi:AraC-like DNA-binding protein